MPEVLKKWLEGLSKNDADEIFNYIDGDPQADSEMLEILSDILDT
jgi:hypothetical protein